MTYNTYIQGGSTPSPLTHSKKPLMTIALAQLTDAQLTEIGWTNGQIKEVRKYHKIPGFQRNAHQRALCRRYSDAQRQVYTVTVKAAPAPRNRGEEWTAEENQLLVDLYLRYVRPTQGVRNRIRIREEFSAVYPDRTSINIRLSTIAGLDKTNPAKGHGLEAGSAALRDALRKADPSRFAV
jgi:hypothetical protein